MRLSHAISPYRITPTSANMKGWSETAAKPKNSLVLVCSALVCCAGWHRFTILVSGFCSSSFHAQQHTTPAAWHRPPSEAVSPSAGLDLSAPPCSWVCDHHCRPSRAGLWHSLWPVPCRAHSCLGRGRPMSRLTFILTYSFCKNPISPIQQLVF